MRVLLLTCLMLTIVMSGCVSKDISSVVNTLPEVQQYLKEHPDAKVAATFWPKDEVSKSLQEIDRQCGKSVTAVDMYRVIITEENLKIVSWVDANNKELICSLTEGGTKIETTGAISTPTTISTPLITPVTTYDVISTPMVTPTKMKATIVPTIVPIHTTIQTKSPTFTMSTENGVITIKGEVDKYQFIDRDTDIFYISEGLTTFNMNHKGDGNFMINMKDDKGNLVEVGIANEIGDYDGIKHIKVVRSGKYYLNIFAD